MEGWHVPGTSIRVYMDPYRTPKMLLSDMSSESDPVAQLSPLTYHVRVDNYQM